MEKMMQLLKEQGLTIGSCESFTAGLFCASLGSVPGASAVLKGGIVTYATEVKRDLLHVDDAILNTDGVISAACARAMAEQARKLLDVDICVSFTGNAGPAAMEGKPAGLVYCALAHSDGCEVFELRLQMERNALRSYTVQYMSEQVVHLLRKRQKGKV